MAHVLRGTIKRQQETINRLKLENKALREFKDLHTTKRIQLKVLSGSDIKLPQTPLKRKFNMLKTIIRRVS